MNIQKALEQLEDLSKAHPQEHWDKVVWDTLSLLEMMSEGELDQDDQRRLVSATLHKILCSLNNI